MSKRPVAVPPRSRSKPDEWEVRDALETLRRAEAIKAKPAMMREVTKLHNSTGQAIKVASKGQK